MADDAELRRWVGVQGAGKIEAWRRDERGSAGLAWRRGAARMPGNLSSTWRRWSFCLIRAPGGWPAASGSALELQRPQGRRRASMRDPAGRTLMVPRPYLEPKPLRALSVPPSASSQIIAPGSSAVKTLRGHARNRKHAKTRVLPWCIR